MAKPLVPSIVVAAGAALGVLTVVFDWGWVVWMIALGLCAFGLFFLSAALGKTKRMLVVGGITAVAVVVGGIGAVRLQPALPAGFAIGENARVVGRSGDTIVVAGAGQGVRGLSLSGDELWASDARADDEDYRDASGGETPNPEVTVVDDLVVAVTSDETPNTTGRVAIGLDAATGEEEWSRNLPAASEFLTATPATLVFSAPAEGLTALYLATGIPRWTNPDGAVSTFRSAGYRHLPPRVIAPKNEAWGLLQEDDPEAPDAASINLDSGELGPRMSLGEADYTMVGGILVTEEFGFGANAAATLRGASVDGRVSWSKQIDADGALDVSAIDGQIVVHTSRGTSVIVASSGELTELSARGSLIAGTRILGDSHTEVLVSRISDAVGGETYRYEVVAEGSVQLRIYADSDEATWQPGVLQIGDRVVALH